MLKTSVSLLVLLIFSSFIQAQSLDKGAFRLAGKDVVVVTPEKPSFILSYTDARAQGVAEQKTVIVCRSLSSSTLDNQVNAAKASGYLLSVVSDSDERFPVGATKYIFKDGDLRLQAPFPAQSGMVMDCSSGTCKMVPQVTQGMLQYIQSPFGCENGNCSTGRRR